MTLKDTILKYYSQFTDLCDKNFKFAEYLGPTIVKEMSEETLTKRVSNTVYRMQFGNEKELTVFDMIVVGEFATRIMNKVAEKKNTEEYSTYRLDKLHTIGKLAQIALRGSSKYIENSYAACIYTSIMTILTSTMTNLSVNPNMTQKEKEKDQVVFKNMSAKLPSTFMNDVRSVNEEYAAIDDKTDDCNS